MSLENIQDSLSYLSNRARESNEESSFIIPSSDETLYVPSSDFDYKEIIERDKKERKQRKKDFG